METSTGLIVPKRSRRPTGIDLFCGCGGASLGFIQAGFEVVGAADNEPAATQTYMVNLCSYPCDIHFVTDEDQQRLETYLARQMFSRGSAVRVVDVSGSARPADRPAVRHFFFGDLRKLSGHDILSAIGMEPGDVDCVFGGPPCQGFSSVGKRQIEDPRNSLIFDFARLVLEIRPKSILMENVPGIVSMVTPEGIPVMDALCRVLEDGDFGTFNSLKRSLLASAGCGATLRTGKKNQGRQKEEIQPMDPEQGSLFRP
jgi:DNA (cytosine-5)-methyltransferase 1